MISGISVRDLVVPTEVERFWVLPSDKNLAGVEIEFADNEDRAKMNDVYREFFTDHKPARATVAVQLGRPDLLIEIQAIAVLDA